MLTYTPRATSTVYTAAFQNDSAHWNYLQSLYDYCRRRNGCKACAGIDTKSTDNVLLTCTAGTMSIRNQYHFPGLRLDAPLYLNSLLFRSS